MGEHFTLAIEFKKLFQPKKPLVKLVLALPGAIITIISTLCTSGVKKEQIAYLLQVQFHFEIDALNTVSATFEITKIFFTLQVTLAMKH